MGRAFSIFWQKMDGANPSEMDIKVFIPAPTFCLQSWYYEFPWLGKENKITKMEKWRNKLKYKIHDFSTKIHLIIIFMLISSSVMLFDFYSFRNEEKPVSLLVYSSFRRVSTSGIRNRSVATSSISWLQVSRARMRSEYGVTPYAS